MIRLSATATHGLEDRIPICFVLYAQPEMGGMAGGDELSSFAQRFGLAVLPSLWNGGPLAAVEVMVREVSQPEAAVLSILALFEQQGMQVEWLQDLVPDMPYQATVPNVFPTRAEFLETLANLASTSLAHDT